MDIYGICIFSYVLQGFQIGNAKLAFDAGIKPIKQLIERLTLGPWISQTK